MAAETEANVLLSLVPDSSGVCGSSVLAICKEIRAWHKGFAVVATLGCIRFGLNRCAWFRMHIVRCANVSSTKVYWHFRIKTHKNEATGLCISSISCFSFPVTVTVGGQQHLLGLYDTAGQVNYCKTFMFSFPMVCLLLPYTGLCCSCCLWGFTNINNQLWVVMLELLTFSFLFST